jgi:hypothetical protein
MYSKQQASQLRQEFWTVFGRYMQPVLSSGGEKVNWVNYKTGAKNIYFRMQAGKGASIAIELTHPAEALRLEYYEKFRQLRTILNSELDEEWIWKEHEMDENGRIISRIYTELDNVNIFNKEDWPALVSFFKPRIIGLDAFWNHVKHGFDVW